MVFLPLGNSVPLFMVSAVLGRWAPPASAQEPPRNSVTGTSQSRVVLLKEFLMVFWEIELMARTSANCLHVMTFKKAAEGAHCKT